MYKSERLVEFVKEKTKIRLIIYCLFKLKRKLCHSLRRPSHSDLVQFKFVELTNHNNLI